MWEKLFQRWKRNTSIFRGTPLFMALMLWVCALPLVTILVVPFLGWSVAAYLAGFLLLADVLACFILCRFRLPKEINKMRITK